MTTRYDALTYQERGEKTYWTRIGVAFQADKGGWNISLDALPINGKIMLREPLPKRDAAEATSGAPPWDDEIPL